MVKDLQISPTFPGHFSPLEIVPSCPTLARSTVTIRHSAQSRRDLEVERQKSQIEGRPPTNHQ
jgi:hypothetical protein